MYYASAKEMEKLDEIAVQSGLEIRQMMELAGWHIVPLFHTLGINQDSKIVVVCGTGNKGGDGLSAARHLANYGYSISVILVSEDIKSDPLHHLRLLKKMKIPIAIYREDRVAFENIMSYSDVVIDALLGYHLEGAPRDDFADVIEHINTAQKQVIAYDIPSGVDATSGECLKPCIQAQATLSLAIPKKCFQTDEGKIHAGKVYLADIGISQFLYDQISPGSRPDFRDNGLIRLL